MSRSSRTILNRNIRETVLAPAVAVQFATMSALDTDVAVSAIERPLSIRTGQDVI
jgi:hypothetical protein